jgi:hypothetical protein
MFRLHVFAAAVALSVVPQPAWAGNHGGDPHWLQTFDSRCWVYEPAPELNEKVSWEGNCDANGDATGSGKATWFIYNDWKIVETGAMRGGMQYGWWDRRDPQGRTETVLFDAGQRRAVAGQGQTPNSGSGQYQPSAPSSPSLGDQMSATLERQRRENCARRAMGANIGGRY